MAADTVTLKAQCLCKTQTFTTTVPRTSLPLKGSSCHCDSCRHLTGAHRSADAPWPGAASAIVSAANDGNGTLKRYQFSPRSNVVFCGKCGSKLFWEEFGQPQAYQSQSQSQTQSEEGNGDKETSYCVFTGVLSAVDSDGKDYAGGPLVRYVDHIFAGDTRDGGAVCWLRRLNGAYDDDNNEEPVKVWLGGRGRSEEVPPGEPWPAVKDLPAHGKGLKAVAGEKEGNVPIRCKCGGVDLVLRAGEAQREWEVRQKNGEELPFFVDPVTHKFLASQDCCDSCRIWAGSEIMNWTFTLLRHISFAGEPAFSNTTELRAAADAHDPRLGTFKYYASSPDVQRYFCGRCSASLFYAVDSRPDMVDVAIGLLASPDGARAESVTSWSWGGQFSWEKDMVGTWREGMLRAVKKDSEQWRIARGYPKSWLRKE